MGLPVEDPSNPDNILTFGPPEEWASAYRWAERHGIWNSLVELIDVSLVQAASPQYRKQVLGSLLEAIARPTSRYLYSRWARHSIHAEGLFRIGEAVRLERTILNDYPPCGFEFPAKHFLKGKLDHLYLVAMCVARTPVVSVIINEDHVRWHETLIAWLILAAHVAYRKGYRLENYLHRVCSRLRIATDEEQTDWLILIAKVARPQERCGLLPQFEQLLAFRVENLNKTLLHEGEKGSFLTAVIEIARHHADEFNVSGKSFILPKVIGTTNGVPVTNREGPHIQVTMLEDDESGSDSASVLSGESPEESAIQVITSVPTLPFQRLTGKSILVASTEELHFLPWSWICPTEFEKKWLSKHLDTLMASEIFTDQLLGALIVLAETTARSMRRILEIEIGSHPQPEWTWIPNEHRLVRNSRRRYSGWHPKTPSELDWVREDLPTQTLHLNQQVQDILIAALQKAPSAKCLGDLWAATTALSPEVAFNSAVAETCPRLSAGMLGRALSVSLHTTTKDATFAKLATSHPNSALPGACAYGSWTSQQLQSALVTAGSTLSDDALNSPDNDSALGSLLAVLEDLLPDAFERAAFRVTELREALEATNLPIGASAVVEFHNGFVAYIVVQLLAATGARPVLDVFESPLDFNFNLNFVYVEDKAHIGVPNGRLIPLPKELARFIGTTYRMHLASLARLIGNVHPSMATEIDKLVAGTHSHRIPLFFFLRNDKEGIHWESVGESSISGLGIFDWPLPLNLFRHRLANRLRDSGIDPEIIDGLLGHGESGAESYGDESWRTWQSDFDVAGPAINAVFSALNSPWLIGLPESLPPLAAVPNKIPEPAVVNTSFGRAARKERRAAWLKEAKADATFHRKQLLFGRNLAMLTPEELDDIGRQLLLNTKGMPHARGWFKYQRFLDVLERHGQITHRRYRPKHHYIQQVSATAFNDLAPRSANSFQSFAEKLNTALKATKAYSYQQAATFAALLLCMESRIADFTRLAGVMRSEGYRVLHLEDQYYVELGTDIRQMDPDVSARRHRISGRAASYLQYAQSRQVKARNEVPDVPAALKQFTTEIEALLGSPICNCHDLLQSLTALADQWNVMTLPGVVAGYLAGRNESWSLPVRTWSYQLTGVVRNFPEAESEQLEAEFEEPILIKGLTSSNQESLVSAADLFFREFRAKIRAYEDHEPAELAEHASDTKTAAAEIEAKSHDDSEPANTGRPSRRNLRRSLLRYIDAMSGTVAPTLLLFAKWITTLVTRRNKGRFVAVSSLRRYLTALSRPLSDLAFNSDIRLMDANELTELYADILAQGRHRRAAYRYERLRAFHRWCEANHDVVRPDWSELPCYAGTLPADAGIILEADYLEALSVLINSASGTRRERHAPALLLLLCYRFGLRPKEAIGIRRDELLVLGRYIQIIVQTNNIRRTKVPVASRRVVPLVFELAQIERKLLDGWLGALEAIAGSRRDIPIFCNDAGQHLDLDRISERVREVLKQVTGNSDTVLYHARHTAGTAVAMALGDLELPGQERLSGISSADQRQNIQRMLLGYPGVSRRSPWALARYLGHTGTDRARASYLHHFGDWADHLIWKSQSDAALRRNIDGVFDLDALTPVERCQVGVPASDDPLSYKSSVVSVIQFLRMLGRGYSSEIAAARLSIPDELAIERIKFIETVDRRLHLPADPEVEEGKESTRFLKHVTEDGWQRLLSVGMSLSLDAINETLLRHDVGINDIRLDGLNMIGPTRQLTMWNIEQLGLLKSLLEIWNIPLDQQLMVGPVEKLAGGEFKLAATLLGFDIRPLKYDPKKSSVQIDARLDFKHGAKNLENFALRVAFLFVEKAGQPIRNSFEWLVACVALLILVPELQCPASEVDALVIKRRKLMEQAESLTQQLRLSNRSIPDV